MPCGSRATPRTRPARQGRAISLTPTWFPHATMMSSRSARARMTVLAAHGTPPDDDLLHPPPSGPMGRQPTPAPLHSKRKTKSVTEFSKGNLARRAERHGTARHGKQFCKRSGVFKGIPSLSKCYNACKVLYRCESGGITVKTGPMHAASEHNWLTSRRQRLHHGHFRAQPPPAASTTGTSEPGRGIGAG